MSFKDQLAKDIENVFFNTNEFAESCTLDGVQLKCINDSDINEERGFDRAHSFDDGLIQVEVVIFFKTADFPYRLVKGVQVEFNNETRDVVEVKSNAGVTELKLGAVLS